MNKTVRYILLVTQATIGLLFIALMSQGVIELLHDNPGASAIMLSLKYFMPATLHIIVSIVAAILLCVFYRANTGAEAQLLPSLFLMITLGNIKVMPLYVTITHNMVLSPYTISLIFHFATLFTAYLLVGSGLFQQGISSSKLTNYIVIGAIITIFLTILTPVSLNSTQFLTEASLTDWALGSIIYILEALAIINFIIVALRERNRHNTGRCIAFILLIIGNSMLSNFQALPANIVGIVLYITGVTILVLVTRTYHIWA